VIFARRISSWQSQGYRLKLIFLSLPNVELAISRVAARVAQGGHDVPEDVIRRRFHSGLRNFNEIYKRIVDEWILYDNSAPAPLILEHGGKLEHEEQTS